jgi:hypothetical protein
MKKGENGAILSAGTHRIFLYFNERHAVVLLIVQKLNEYLSKHN